MSAGVSFKKGGMPEFSVTVDVRHRVVVKARDRDQAKVRAAEEAKNRFGTLGKTITVRGAHRIDLP